MLDIIPSNDDQFKDALIGEIWRHANGLPEKTREVLEIRCKEDMTLKAID